MIILTILNNKPKVIAGRYLSFGDGEERALETG